MKKYKFTEKDVVLINFDVLFNNIEFEVLNELNNFSLIKDYKINLSNKDTKKIFYHYLIYNLCEEICNNKHKQKKVIVIPPNIREFHEMTNFCDNKELQLFINTLINHIKGKLPIIFYNSTNYIFESDNIHNSGEFEDIINVLSEKCNNISNKSFTFEKIKKFIKRFELTFLSEEYFNSIKTKLLLC